jgi:hypothetical protein
MIDVDLEGAGAAEHAGKHGNSLLGEGVGCVLDVLASLQGHRL